jgi:hypothetical protein
MKPEKEKSEEKKCGESCGCADVKDDQKIEEKKVAEKIESDPTRFGDWQVNCRAIDF